MDKLRLYFAALLGIAILLSAPQVSAQFNPLDSACTGQADASGVCQDAQTQGTVNPITGDDGIATAIARILMIVVGVAAVIMLILGGLSFITAGGNAEQEARARRRVLYGVVGISVAAAGWAIITLILNRLL